MKILNVEIKARCHDLRVIRSTLEKNGARHTGQDHQIDTYYRVPRGRLKLRQGNIENALIAYAREDQSGPKRSDVRLFRTQHDPALKETLDASLDILVIVDKVRDIYFIDHIKFHLDHVDGLGYFIEIEAIDESGNATEESLRRDCQNSMLLLGIRDADLVQHSYSDMLFDMEEGS